MPRKTFGHKREELTAAWETRVMIGEILKFLMRKFDRKQPFERPSVNKMIILKMGWMHPTKNRDSKRLL
jgi:hypothetical protein